MQGQDTADSYSRTATTRINAARVLLFNTGQIATPPTGRVIDRNWRGHLLPNPPTPDPGSHRALPAALRRYPHPATQTIRHIRDALRRLVVWLTTRIRRSPPWPTYDREHAEEFLGWLGAPQPAPYRVRRWPCRIGRPSPSP